MVWHQVFGVLILCLAGVGVALNCAGMALLTVRRARGHRFTMFHSLLRMLSAFDLAVVVGGALSYGLPNVWSGYTVSVLPKISQALIPAVHMALMASVYCTVLISLERYVRICLLCQLRESSLVTEENIKWYKLAVVLFPVAFYAPKFFEVRWDYTTVSYNSTDDCGEVILRSLASNTSGYGGGGGEKSGGGSISSLFSVLSNFDGAYDYSGNFSDVTDVVIDVLDHPETDEAQLEATKLAACVRLVSLTGAFFGRRVTVQRSRRFLELTPTTLRQSPTYYRVYCVFLNTLLAAVAPLAALVFLNISTFLALRRMANKDDADQAATAVAAASSSSSSAAKIPLFDLSSCAESGISTTRTTTTRVTASVSVDAIVSAAAATAEEGGTLGESGVLGQATKRQPFRSKEDDGGGASPTTPLVYVTTSRSSVVSGSFAFSVDTIVEEEEEEEEDKEKRKRGGRSSSKNDSAPKSSDCGCGGGDAGVPETKELGGGGDEKAAAGVPSSTGDNERGPLLLLSETPSSHSHPRPTTSTTEVGEISASSGGCNEGESRASPPPLLEVFPSGGDRAKAKRSHSTPAAVAGGAGDDDVLSSKRKIRICSSNSGGGGMVSYFRRRSESVRTPSPAAAAAAVDDHSEQERRLARISMSIVWLFTFCHAWKAVPTVYEWWHSDDGLNVESWPFWLVIVEHLSHTLITFNSAVNFLIYVLK